jgi:hypothetical protein
MGLWERVAASKEKHPGWTYKIINEALVPAEYLSVDPMKVHKAFSKGIRDIPGLLIYELGQPFEE